MKTLLTTMKTILITGTLLGAVAGARAETLALSQLDLSKATMGYGAAGRDKSVGGHALSIGNRAFATGFGAHSPSVLRVQLDGRAKRFSAWVGVDDEVRAKSGSVVFRVLGDGRELFRSNVLHNGDAAHRVEVALEGVKSLILIAGDAGDGNANDHADWGEGQIEFAGQAPIAVAPPTATRVRLTPPALPLPQLNGAHVFGVRPGVPLLFQIAASGQRPLRFSAKLPEGVRLDAQTGFLTGVLVQTGRYPIPVTVSNARGQAKRELVIQVGDDILLTPPMGWNSWYQMSEAVSDAGVRDVARAMKEKGLTDYGWTYVNIDDCWQGKRGGPNLALQANAKFPDMKAMCDFLHAQGLKAGIYSTPWVSSYAGFRGGSSPNADGSYPIVVPPEKRLQPGQIFGRAPGYRLAGMNHIGEYWFFDRDAQQIADWGFDYIKMDWAGPDVNTTKHIESDLRKTGRDITLSLSNSTRFENAPQLSQLAQAWRTTGDIHDNWASVLGIANAQERWAPFTKPGHWNDPDMLQIGNIGVPNQFNTVSKPTNLTPDEQYFQVSLWSLLSAPLLLSCDISSLYDFTLGLLTNAEVIAVDQDALGKPARRIALGENRFAWVKPLEDGSLAVGLFNTDEVEGEVALPLQSLGLGKTVKVRDLWRQKDLGQFSGEFKTIVNSHGVVLLRLSS